MEFFTLRTPEPQKRLHREILQSLSRIAPPLQGDTYPQQSDWPTTRQIADEHNISIYKARLVLLEMQSKELVMVSNTLRGHTLRWYPR